MAKPSRKIDEVFPVLAVEDGIIVSRNGDLTVPYELVMPEIFTISKGDYNRMHRVFTRALQSVETNIVVHKQDWYLTQPYQPDFERYPGSEVNLARCDERHFAERPILLHHCRLFITRPMEEVLKRTSSQTSLLSPRLVPREVRDPTYRQLLLEVAEQFVRALEESKLFTTRRLSDDEIDYQLTPQSIYQQYFSLSTDDLSLTDIEMAGEFKVNGKFCGVTSVGELDEFPVNLTNQLPIEKYQMGKHSLPGSLGYRVGMSLPFNHVYNQIFYVDDTRKLLKKLEGEANRMTSFSLHSQQNVENLQFKKEFIQKQLTTGDKVVRVHANVMTWNADREKMLSQRSMVNAGFTRMGFTPRQAVHDAPALYWSCIPGNASQIGKDNLALCFAGEGACLLALENNYRDACYNQLGVKLVDRSGRPVSVDIFIETLKKGLIDNRNCLLVGPSGSGKSFLMNQIQYHLLEQEADIMMVDTGHSYKRLCDQMGGVYISFDKDNPLEFNPFFMDSRLSSDQVAESKQNLAALLLSLWKSETEDIKKSEEVGIDGLVNAYYAYLETKGKGIFPCFNSFFDFFNDHYLPNHQHIRDQEIDFKNFKFVMARFYKDAYLGYLLNAGPDNQINRLLDERFAVFEMDNIKDNKTLHTVTTIAIMNLYVRKLMRKGEKAIFSMLIIEEAWRLVGDPRFAQFLKWVSKTARKHFGSLVSVTQEPSDLQSPMVKDAIIKNSAVKILLDFSSYKNQSTMVQEILGLSDEETALLMSVNQGRDAQRKYKECFISWNGTAKVYGVEVSRESYAAFTTEKTEVAAIEHLKRRYGSYERAITGFARGEHLPEKRSATAKKAEPNS